MADFKKLHVWRKAHALMLNVHRVASGIRGAVNLSLRSQTVRAAMSIPTNIVEGRAQKGDREFARFLRIALASASELEYHLIAARDIGVVSETDFLFLINHLTEVQQMLHGLINRLDAIHSLASRSEASREQLRR